MVMPYSFSMSPSPLHADHRHNDGHCWTSQQWHRAFGVKIYVDAMLTYSDDDVSLTEVGTLAVQSHWGSGVVFSNMDITAK